MDLKSLFEVQKKKGSDKEKRSDAPMTIDDMRIIEGVELNKLESLDEDGSIMDVPLHLDDSCDFIFEKHMDAILGDQEQAQAKLLREQKRERPDQEMDRRYKEMPRDRIKFK